MKKSLKHAMHDQLETISLSEQQLDKLMKIQQAAASEDLRENTFKDTHATIPTRTFGYLAASVLIFFLVSFSLVSYLSNKSGPTTLIQQIANEVAGNHLKMKPMEVQTGNISDVQSYFTKLDFMPLQSQQMENNSGIQLAGGRYCSIQGSSAAQLRYKNKKGGYTTLFETPYSPELFRQLPDTDKGENPVVTYARGIKVTMWIERGLLMVSTEKPE